MKSLIGPGMGIVRATRQSVEELAGAALVVVAAGVGAAGAGAGLDVPAGVTEELEPRLSVL